MWSIFDEVDLSISMELKATGIFVEGEASEALKGLKWCMGEVEEEWDICGFWILPPDVPLLASSA